jgi:hypothetical protein
VLRFGRHVKGACNLTRVDARDNYQELLKSDSHSTRECQAR